MNPRAWLMAVMMLVSPAWSQGLASDSPVVTPRSFDLRSESLKTIVRNTAATQFAAIQLPRQQPVQRESTAFKYVPPADAEPVQRPTPRLPEWTPEDRGFFSALVGTLIDSALGVESYDSQAEYHAWLSCKLRDDSKCTRRY
jgi:hypothetical protein